MGAPVTVPAGNALPGVPKSQAYAQLRYRQPTLLHLRWRRFTARKVPVNDANSEFAERLYRFQPGRRPDPAGQRLADHANTYAWITSTDRNYVGSVIVNEGNGRFYEPSPRRSMTVGIQASVQF